MFRWIKKTFVFCAVLPVAAVGFGAEKPNPAHRAFFEKKIRPILIEHCYGCHSQKARKLKGELYLDSRAGWQAGGASGLPAVVPGKPDQSPLIKAVRYDDPDFEMPPKKKLPQKQIDLLNEWVRLGAPDPRTGGKVPEKKQGVNLEEARRYWAFKPLADPQPPATQDKQWARTPVDRFILAKLEAEGLRPNGSVDREKLIRRAYFDLIGLPPTPQQIDAFVQDPSPDAYAKLIDRLLDSPHHGERWGRHWLDVARFAESYGFEQDYDRKSAYHFRDFVIKALNRDMPFDQFVRWQLAGDEIAPDRPLALMATGFLAAGVFPTQLTEREFEKARYDELDDMVSTVGSAMLGLTIGCARCHDHKYDPIPARDYYRMVATFTTTIRNEMKVPMSPVSAEAQARFEAAHRPLVERLRKYEQQKLPAALKRWAAEARDRTGGNVWTMLKPEQCRSKNGTRFKVETDGTVMASGKTPKQEIYTLTLQTELTGINAIRLDALTHPSLKRKGPGRAGNGNFVLSNIQVQAAPLRGGEPVKVDLADARATHQQHPGRGKLSVAASLDKDHRNTGWAVDGGGIGRDQTAVFHTGKPFGFKGGTKLTVTLSFGHPNPHHSLGRFRIGLSTASKPVPLRGMKLPGFVQRYLARAGQEGAFEKLSDG
ncbi:MAG: DUF1549 domain-containing protein, partial [Phycisphaeraceae bacterium]|nr:DUF1549 domain-containing protein [Phycisphaeraceae bacterium]